MHYLYSGYSTSKFRSFCTPESYYLAFKCNLNLFSPQTTNRFRELINQEKDVKYISFEYNFSPTVKESRVIETLIINTNSKYLLNTFPSSTQIRENITGNQIKIFRYYYYNIIYKLSINQPLQSFELNFNQLFKPLLDKYPLDNASNKFDHLNFMVLRAQQYKILTFYLSPKELVGVDKLDYTRNFSKSKLSSLGWSKLFLTKLLCNYRAIHKIRVSFRTCKELEELFDNYIKANRHLVENKTSKYYDIEDLKIKANEITSKLYGLTYSNENEDYKIINAIRYAKKRALVSFIRLN